jgi:hypothetical protein
MQYYMPPLDETLAKRFGHDGQGLQFNQRYKERSDIKQSVRVGNDGLLTFVEGYSEAAIIKGKAQGLPEANKYGHEDEPVITQTIELGDNIKTVEVELFYRPRCTLFEAASIRDHQGQWGFRKWRFGQKRGRQDAAQCPAPSAQV